LALALDYAAGYSIEPYHIINLLERYGGIQESPKPEVMKERVEVYQIESRNPHLHEAGDREHIDQMRYLAMQVLYHSPICPGSLRKKILRDASAKGYMEKEHDVDKPHYFPPISKIDRKQFLDIISDTPYGRLIGNGVGKESRQ
jgi:mannosyl-3-phosphoglycerate synthase